MARLELDWPDGVRVLIIDEKGMLAQVLLAWIDIRLRTLFDSDKPFGDIHVILLGDFQQLDPVQARTLYDLTRCDNRKDSALVYRAQDLYEKFDIAIELTTNYRMKQKPGEDPATTTARVKLLEKQKKIAIGECDKHDHPYWADYMDTNAERRNDFLNDPDTIHIVSTNPQAAQLNADFIICMCTKTKQPVWS
jgi:hypothetical protein